jgi:hypothetical protein
MLFWFCHLHQCLKLTVFANHQMLVTVERKVAHQIRKNEFNFTR